MSEKLIFASEDEALQYLANITSKRVVVADDNIKTAVMYSHGLSAEPTGKILRGILQSKYNDKIIRIKRGTERLEINAIETVGKYAYLIAVKTITPIDELKDEDEETKKQKEEITPQNKEKKIEKDVKMRKRITPNMKPTR